MFGDSEFSNLLELEIPILEFGKRGVLGKNSERRATRVGHSPTALKSGSEKMINIRAFWSGIETGFYWNSGWERQNTLRIESGEEGTNETVRRKNTI